MDTILTAMLSEETGIQQMMGQICCHLSFALLRASVISIRARSSANMPGMQFCVSPLISSQLKCPSMNSATLLKIFIPPYLQLAAVHKS